MLMINSTLKIFNKYNSRFFNGYKRNKQKKYQHDSQTYQTVSEHLKYDYQLKFSILKYDLTSALKQCINQNKNQPKLYVIYFYANWNPKIDQQHLDVVKVCKSYPNCLLIGVDVDHYPEICAEWDTAEVDTTFSLQAQGRQVKRTESVLKLQELLHQQVTSMEEHKKSFMFNDDIDLWDEQDCGSKVKDQQNNIKCIGGGDDNEGDQEAKL